MLPVQIYQKGKGLFFKAIPTGNMHYLIFLFYNTVTVTQELIVGASQHKLMCHVNKKGNMWMQQQVSVLFLSTDASFGW